MNIQRDIRKGIFNAMKGPLIQLMDMAWKAGKEDVSWEAYKADQQKMIEKIEGGKENERI